MPSFWNIISLGTVACALALARGVVAAPGDLDESLAIRLENQIHADHFVIQDDGSIVIANDGPRPTDQQTPRVIRFRPDGRRDASFNTADLPLRRIWQVGATRGGKVFVRGDFTEESFTNGLARLNADGSLDQSFVPQLEPGLVVRAMASTRDGKVIVYTPLKGITPDGHIDQILRLNSDGTVDEKFNNAWTMGAGVNAIDVQPDGKISLVGQFLAVDGEPRFGVARLMADGSLDKSFTPPAATRPDTQFPFINNVSTSPQGKILIAGEFTDVGGTARRNVAQLNSDGSLDTTFVPPPIDGGIEFALAQIDGKVIIAGAFNQVGTAVRHGLARLNADGSADEGYLLHSEIDYRFQGAVMLRDDRLVARGFGNPPKGSSFNFVCRLHGGDAPAGPSLLVTQPMGQTKTKGQSVSFEVLTRSFPSASYQWQRNGRDLPGETNAVLRLADLDFAEMGSYSLVASNTLGTVFTRPAHLIVNAEPVAAGSVDLAFNAGSGANGQVTAIALQGEKIVLAGDFTSWDGVAAEGIVRLNRDGNVDPTFHAATGVRFGIQSVVATAGGGLYASGSFTEYSGVHRHSVVRLKPDGEVDESFVPKVPLMFYVRALEILPGGKVLVGGFPFDDPTRTVFRLNSDGNNDASFARKIDTQEAGVAKMVVQHDGGIVLGGSNPRLKSFLLRLTADGKPDPGFTPPGELVGPITALLPLSGGSLLVSLLMPAKFPGYARPVSFVRLGPDGRVDGSFQALNIGLISTLVPTPDGSILVAGSRLWRMKPEGTLEKGFEVRAAPINAIAFPTDGNILIAGGFQEVNKVPRRSVARVFATDKLPQALLFGPFLSSDGFTIYLPTVNNRVYLLEFTEGLEAPQWKPLSRLPGDGNWHSVADPEAQAPRRFYRVRVE